MTTLIISVSPLSPPNTFTYENNTNNTYGMPKNIFATLGKEIIKY